MKKFMSLCLLLVLAATLFSVPLQAQETVEIEFVHIFGGEGDVRADVIQAIAADFMAENPGVVINVRSTSTAYDEVFNAALLSASQGNAPHLVQVEEGLTQLAADSGFFLAIGDLASPEQLASQDDVLEVVRSYYTIDEKVWSLPWNSSNPVLYYNKSITDALGIEISATEPLTFDEMLAICDNVAAAAAAVESLSIAACANWPMVSWFPEQWLAMQDALVVNNDNGRSARATESFYNSPEMLQIVEWLAEMAARGHFIYTGALGDYNGEGGLFVTGPTVFHINSTAGITLFVNGFASFGLELGIAPLPIPDADATNGVTVGGASVWVTDGHSEAETQAAVDFAFYLTSPENDIRWHQGSGYFPNRQSSIEFLSSGGGIFVDADGNPTTADAEGAIEVSWFDAFPFFRVALDQLANSNNSFANAGGVMGPSAEVRTILAQAIQSVVDQGISPAEALDAAKQRADAVIAEYNAVVGQ